MKVKVDELSVAVWLELSSYAEEIRDGLAEAVKSASALCVRILKATSPKRTGAYAKNWTRLLSKPPEEPAAVIYNKRYGWLAHLLENGHAKAGGGRVEALPHIRPAAEQTEQQFLNEVTKLLEETQ